MKKKLNLTNLTKLQREKLSKVKGGVLSDLKPGLNPCQYGIDTDFTVDYYLHMI